MDNITAWLTNSFDHLKVRWQAYIGPTLVFFGLIFGIVMVMMTLMSVTMVGLGFALVGPEIRSEMERERQRNTGSGSYNDPYSPNTDPYSPNTDPYSPGDGSSQGSPGYSPPPSGSHGPPQRMMQMMGLFWLGYFIIIFGAAMMASVIVAPLQLRFMRGTLSLLRGGEFKMGDLFRGKGDVLRSVGLMIVLQCVMMVAMMFFYFPALLLGCLFMFSFPVMADRKVGPIEAMKISMELAKTNYWYVLLYMFLCSAIAGLANAIPLVGALASLPVMTVMILVAYRGLLGETQTVTARQQVPPQQQTPGQAMASQEQEQKRVTF